MWKLNFGGLTGRGQRADNLYNLYSQPDVATFYHFDSASIIQSVCPQVLCIIPNDLIGQFHQT